ncbi:MAG: hypothetical protein ACODAU_12425 [Myxococcota bacterium]
MRALAAFALAAGLVGLGCEDRDQEPEEATQEEATAPEPAEEVRETGPTAEQVPLPEDFAHEVEADITEENYLEKLEELEKEIEADIGER